MVRPALDPESCMSTRVVVRLFRSHAKTVVARVIAFVWLEGNLPADSAAPATSA